MYEPLIGAIGADQLHMLYDSFHCLVDDRPLMVFLRETDKLERVRTANEQVKVNLR
jgi:hypothetical protein